MSFPRLRALFFTDPLIVVATLGMGLLSLFVSLFDKSGRRQHRMAVGWARILLRIAGVKLRVEGLERIRLDRHYVFVANHRSFMDIPVLLSCLPTEIRFMAKKGLFQIPLLGGHLKRAGHLVVARGDPRASVKSMTDAARVIRDLRISVLLFPEGGRTDGELKDFKEGAAFIAVKSGAPIVPVAMLGLRDILPKGSLLVKPGGVTVRIADPIPTAHLTIKDRHHLTVMLHDRIAELLGDTTPKPQETR